MNIKNLIGTTAIVLLCLPASAFAGMDSPGSDQQVAAKRRWKFREADDAARDRPAPLQARNPLGIFPSDRRIPLRRQSVSAIGA